MSNLDRSLFEDSTIPDSRWIRGVVVNRVDPLMEGRVAVIIPRIQPTVDPYSGKARSLTSHLDTTVVQNEELKDAINPTYETSNFIWARPCKSATGSFRVPYEKDTVYVFMEDGDPQKLYYTSEAPTLRGQVSAMDQIKSSGDVWTPDKRPNVQIIDEFKDGTTIYYNENSESNEYQVKFKGGHSLSISSNESENQIELLTKAGFLITANELGKAITLKTPSGHLINVSDGENKILLSTAGGSIVDMTDDAITAQASTGGKVTIGGGKVNIN